MCCCFINQDDLKSCENEATFRIWMGYHPTPDDYTESCNDHIEDLLDDNTRFELLRIVNE